MPKPNRDEDLHPFSFTLFSNSVRQAVFTRRGGVSPAPFDSLNVSFGVGDGDENVRENRRRLKEALGIARLISCRQVHSAMVRRVEEYPDADVELESCDALITGVAGVALLIQQADCQAVLLHDPVREAVGIAHSGWRGSIANIICATVEAMRSAYGTMPEDLRAGIGPSLGPCCAEFVNYPSEFPPSFHRYQVRPDHFDFWAASRDQLLAAGVREQRIEMAGRCTVCSPEFFSYRREGRTGRFAAVIGLR